MCPKCGKENPTPERSMCPDCAARNSELRKQNRKYHERIGICTHCGKNPAEPNKKLCYECLGQFQDSYSEKGKTDEQKEKNRLRKKAVKTDTHRKRTMPQMRKTSIAEWWFMPEMQGVSEKLQRQKPMRFVTFRETGLRHLLYMWQKSNNEREKGVR